MPRSRVTLVLVVLVVLVIVTERALVGHYPLAFYPRERRKDACTLEHHRDPSGSSSIDELLQVRI